MISELIDKQDSFEIIRDQIAAILATEIANQQVLANNAGKDANLWKIRVFTERSNPWEQFQGVEDGEAIDESPLVNVWYDNSNFDPGASNIMERQKTEAVFNIDCYGYGRSENVDGGGHKAGDEEAAFAVQRTLRLVRNILMAAEYTYLGLRGLVWQRWPQSVTIYQPQIDSRTVQQIVASRLAFRVTFNEYSPQVQPVELELVTTDVLRTEDGEIVVEADYDYTTP